MQCYGKISLIRPITGPLFIVSSIIVVDIATSTQYDIEMQQQGGHVYPLTLVFYNFPPLTYVNTLFFTVYNHSHKHITNFKKYEEKITIILNIF